MRASTLALVVTLAALGACRGVLGIDEPVVVDAGSDAAFDCMGWQPRGLDACAFPPSPPLVLAGPTFTIDTTDGLTLTGPSGAVPISPYHVTPSDGGDTAVLSLAGLRITAGTTLRVIGKRPLILLVWDTLAIDGTLDASSARGAPQPGAGGSDAAFCKDTQGHDGENAGAQVGAGGGGGGGFAGGGGLAGTGGRTVIVGGGAGGGTVAPVLRGGCPGGASGQAGAGAGSGAAPTTHASGGAGGGALRMIARTAITVGTSGAVAANGAGGQGAPEHSGCGGGGGGAGGYLGFQAPRVQLAGAITAHGGGGGGGGGVTDQGHDGEDGAKPALGGAASPGNCGRPGGNGSGPGGLGGAPGDSFESGDCVNSGGGGGGGGGAGYIVVDSTDLTATGAISPPVTPP